MGAVVCAGGALWCYGCGGVCRRCPMVLWVRWCVQEVLYAAVGAVVCAGGAVLWVRWCVREVPYGAMGAVVCAGDAL